MNRWTRWVGVVCVCLWVTGCAGPAPKMFPASPVEIRHLPGGVVERWYDRKGSGFADCCEQLGPDGRIVRIGYSTGPAHTEYVTLADIPPAEQKHLILLLDSVPFEMAREAYEGGRFRYAFPPGRVIAPFPVMTDLSFSEFFGNSPSPGIESQYFNGERLTSGYETYASGGNVAWQKYVDWRLHPMLHVEAYLDPYPWIDHELRKIREGFLASSKPAFVGYVVGASAVGAKYGRDGHLYGLLHVDRMCQELLFETRGRARFTMLSDHGHYFAEHSYRVALSDLLEDLGYRTGKRMRRSTDLIVPEFGMVSSAVIHTHQPERVARDALSINGVEIAAYMSGDEMIVLGRSGRARVTQQGDRFRYDYRQGDPLELMPVIDTLMQKGLADREGYVSDRELFLGSADSAFPDAVARLWRAFHGLVEHAPDVVLSLEQAYFVGDPSMTSLIRLIGVHGSLRPQSSEGFALTAAGTLPPVERMADLRASLQKLGVPVGGSGNDTAPHALPR